MSVNGFKSHNLSYNLDDGNNLISYTGTNGQDTIEALKVSDTEDYEDKVTFIIGQGLGHFHNVDSDGDGVYDG